MKKIMMLLIAAFAMSTASVSAQQPTELPMDPSVRKGKLANGMTYYIRHNEKPKGQADFYIWHDVGAIQENDDQQGLAHFLEHMAFNGTKNLPGKMLTEYLEKIGVKFGADLNAYTTWDRTVYNINNVPTVRQGCIDTAMLILHDWSHFIALEPDEIDSERGVIMEELRTRDNASWRSSFKMLQAVSKHTLYEQRNLIGYLDYLKSFEHQVLRDFYHKWYRPEYQALVIVGDLNVDETEQKLIKLMEDIAPSPADAAQKEVIVVPDNKEPIISIYTDREMQSTAAKLIIKRAARPEQYNNTDMALVEDMLHTYIAIMANNRFQEITMQPNAPFLRAGMSIGGVGICPTLTSTTMMVVTEDGKLNAGFEAAYTELERIRQFGFTAGEYQRAQANLMSWLDTQYANAKNRTNGDLVQECLNNYDSNAPLMSPETEEPIMRQLVMALPLEAINQVAAQLITEENQVIVVDAPEKEGLAAPTEAEILAARANAQQAKIEAYMDEEVDTTLIDPNTKLKGSPVQTTTEDQLMGTTEWILKNGVKVIVKKTDYQADKLQMMSWTNGGLALLADNEADYFMGMLMTGIAAKSGVADFTLMDMQKKLAGKNASVGMYCDAYTSGVSGSCSVKDLETMFQLMYMNYTQPRFGETEYNTMMTGIRQQLANIKTDPGFLMSEAKDAALYNNNPLRRDFNEEIISKFDFKRFPELYKKIFNGVNGYTFVFVGDIEPEVLKPMVEKYIGSLPAKNKKLDFVDDNVRLAKGVVKNDFKVPMQQPKVSVFYNFSGKSDLSIKEALAMEFLGEALNSRYLISIREEKGGTYGVHCAGRIEHDPEAIYRLMIMFDTNEEMADELMEIIMKEIKTIAEEGPVVEDIEKHREFMLKSWENSLENNGAWMSYILMKERRAKNYIADYEKEIRNLKPADVQAMAKRVLGDNNMVHVIMRTAK